MNIQIGDYDVDSVILDLGSDVNILTKQAWQKMGSPPLRWSPVQLRLANHAKVTPIGRVPRLVVDIEGMKTYADFDVIKVVEGASSYPTFLGIGWANDSGAVIYFKRWIMKFENCDLRVISLLDPAEGCRYRELMKDDDPREWDHAFNISKDYIHLISNGELG